VKRHWFEAQYRFAGSLHRLNLSFKPPRGRRRLSAQLTVAVYIDCRDRTALICPINVANKASVAHIRTRTPDTDHVISRGNGGASINAQGDIQLTGGVVLEGTKTVCRVEVTNVDKERRRTSGRVGTARGVAKERVKTVGRVADAHGVAKERGRSIGSVILPDGVA
jgi:hypothetical protein